MTIRLQDTLTGETRPLEPLEPGHVRIYSCGPTVYGPAHIGNFRSFLFADLLVRYLRYRGLRVTWVMNLTDIDDKIIRGAAAEGISTTELADRYAARFLDDAEALGMTVPDVLPRATEHIPQIAELVGTLLDKGHAYRTDDGSDLLPYRLVARVRPPRAARPGRDAGGGARRVGRVRQGRRPRLRAVEGPEARRAVVGHGGRPRAARLAHRVLRDEHGAPRRRRSTSTPAAWTSCSRTTRTRSRSRRPRRASRSSGTWLHCAHLRMGGEKMAKSTGNIARVSDLVASGVSPRALRYALLSVHYRAPLNYTDDSLPAAAAAVERVDALLAALSAYREDRADDETLPALLDRCGPGSRPGSTTISTCRRRWPPCSTGSGSSTAGSMPERCRPPMPGARSRLVRDLDGVLGVAAPPRLRARARAPGHDRGADRGPCGARLGRVGPAARRAARAGASPWRTPATASGGASW